MKVSPQKYREPAPKRPLRFYNVLGRAELRQAQVIFVMVALVTSLVGIVISQQSSLRNYEVLLHNAEANRIMWGFPIKDGVFVSEKTMPETHVSAFVDWYNGNRQNWTQDNVLTNLKEAKKMMSPNFRATQFGELNQVEELVRSRQIEQVFSHVGAYAIQKLDDGFLVSFQARRRRIVNNEVYDDKQLHVEYKLLRTMPNEGYPWGLVVDSQPAYTVVKVLL